QEFPNFKCPCSRPLLLEQILESLPRVVVARRGSGGDLGFLSVGGGSGVLLNRGSKFVESAVVLRVFRSDPFGNRLRTFKLRPGIEEAALLAAVQFELALGTFTVGIEARGEDRAAVGAARAGYGAHHARGAWAELIGPRAALRRLAVVARAIAVRFFLVVFFCVAIPAGTLLSV